MWCGGGGGEGRLTRNGYMYRVGVSRQQHHHQHHHELHPQMTCFAGVRGALVGVSGFGCVFLWDLMGTQTLPERTLAPRK